MWDFMQKWLPVARVESAIAESGERAGFITILVAVHVYLTLATGLKHA